MRRALILLALAGCGTKVVDLAPADAAPPEAALACAAETLSDQVRCLYCKGQKLEQRACLKCESLDPAGVCQQCVWSDDPKNVCKLCTDPNGKMQPDDCDRLRPELAMSPG